MHKMQRPYDRFNKCPCCQENIEGKYRCSLDLSSDLNGTKYYDYTMPCSAELESICIKFQEFFCKGQELLREGKL